jgi:hypothetical protein
MSILGGPPTDPGLLADKNIAAFLTVLPGNNPYGLYQFNESSFTVTIARDSVSNTSTSMPTTANLVVKKTLGAPDYVPVSNLW